MVFPWQSEQWAQLLQAKNMDRLPQALLLTGIKGMGKTHFAESLTRMLLCQADCSACCECHACRLIAGRAHPNVLWVTPEKEGHAIKIDAIREVGEFVSQSSLQGDYRLVMINPANAMNTHAANALLKTLEEPASGAILVLISDQPASLPATIRSRCQRIHFPQPKGIEALVWLKQSLKNADVDAALLLRLAHGAPLAALTFANEDAFVARRDLYQALYALIQKESDPIAIANKMREMDILPWCDYLLSFTRDLLCYQLGVSKEAIINADFIDQMTTLKSITNPKNNHDFMAFVQGLRSKWCNGINLNKQLMIETTLIKWAEGVRHVSG